MHALQRATLYLAKVDTRTFFIFNFVKSQDVYLRLLLSPLVILFINVSDLNSTSLINVVICILGGNK